LLRLLLLTCGGGDCRITRGPKEEEEEEEEERKSGCVMIDNQMQYPCFWLVVFLVRLFFFYGGTLLFGYQQFF
jgi:hypothetical protein